MFEIYACHDGLAPTDPDGLLDQCSAELMCLKLNDLSPTETRALRNMPGSRSLLVGELGQDSVSRAVQIRHHRDAAVTRALHLSVADLIAIYQSYQAISDAYARAGGTLDGLTMLIFRFLKTCIDRERVVLVFSKLSEQEYE